MTNEEKGEFKITLYHNYLDRCLKKNKMDIISNPSGFVRGVPQELASDMYILALDSIERVSNKESLKRLKYICEYFLSKNRKIELSKKKILML